jgi:hypothetical protein
MQGDSGEKINVFGDGSIDNSERKNSYGPVYNYEWLLIQSCSNLQIQKRYEGSKGKGKAIPLQA